jgi:hypothetical protein
MTTNGMTCELFTDRLLPYLEHEVDEATRSAVERHAGSCGDCGALLADLRKLRVDAANLPTLQPSKDLWAGIAARIEAPVLDIGAGRAAPPASRARWHRWTRGAMIAASLVAAAGIGYFAAGQKVRMVARPMVTVPPDTLEIAVVDTMVVSVPVESPTGNVESRSVAAATPAPARSSETQVVLTALVADYDREIARLRTLIEQRRNQLDPTTVAVIDKNIQIIDAAIADSKKAIARDPASRFLIESLNQSLQAKVELMQTAALLPSRT